MKNSDCVTKLDTPIDDEVMKRTIAIQHFLCKNFIIIKVIKMKSDSNQPACVYVIAKIHMFGNLEDITVANFVISLIRLEHLCIMRQNAADYYHYYLLFLSSSIYLKLKLYFIYKAKTFTKKSYFGFFQTFKDSIK